MKEIGNLALHALAGGTLVVLFAMVSEAVRPKAFAGIFAAAPSVAVASLAITVLTESPAKARTESIGMVAGGVGMAVCCIVAVVTIPKLRALRGSLVSAVVWLAVALGLYWAVFIGAR